MSPSSRKQLEGPPTPEAAQPPPRQDGRRAEDAGQTEIVSKIFSYSLIIVSDLFLNIY